MKKVLALALMLTFVATFGYAAPDPTWIATNSILNRCFDSTNNALKSTVSGNAGDLVNVSCDTLTVSSDLVVGASTSGAGLPKLFVDVSTGSTEFSQDGTDKLIISGDSTDSWIKWTDGFLKLQADEGVNASTFVQLYGKGNGESYIYLYDGTSGNDHSFIYQDGNDAGVNFGSSTTDYIINEAGGDTNVRIEGDNTPNLMFIDAGADTGLGRIGIGTQTPTVRLDVIGQGQFTDSDTSYIQLQLTDTNLNNTTQRVGLVSQHYELAEEPIGMMMVFSDGSTSGIDIGGNTDAGHNTATRIRFYTAADDVTTSGTVRAQVDSSGNFYIGNNNGIVTFPGSNALSADAAVYTPNIKSGITQAGAGAAGGELYHCITSDSIKIGV